MKIIEDILRTILGHNEDINNTDEDNFSTVEIEKGNDLGCEQQIIKCQATNGRLLSSTSRSCEIKYGKDTTRRAKQRLAQRRKRGNSSVKKKEEQLGKTLKHVYDIIKKKDNEDYYKNGI